MRVCEIEDQGEEIRTKEVESLAGHVLPAQALKPRCDLAHPSIENKRSATEKVEWREIHFERKVLMKKLAIFQEYICTHFSVQTCCD